MNIQQLSNNIDQKLTLLDKQLATLQQRLASEGENDQMRKELTALEQIKRKLQKSRNIMWQAHELQLGSDQKRLNQKRWLGIGLCVVSGLGLLALLLIVLTQ
jgi:exonuclease VII large subunit